MQLFFTNRAGLSETATMFGHALPPRHEPSTATIVPDRMPFFLAGDGTYEHQVNRFLRDLPASGCQSPDTWEAYAYDIRSLQSFLDRARDGRSCLDATFDDLRAFRAQRLEGSPKEVAPSTWNRAVAALEKFFDYFVVRGELARPPFKYTTHVGRSHWQGMRGRNTLLAAVHDDDEVKCISWAEYQIFRNVGLRGLLPDQRTPDPSFEGRSGERNAMVADLLVCTGARVTEGTSFLCRELRCVGLPATGSTQARIVDAVAKRGHGRTIHVPNRVLGAIGRYVARDRAHAVAGAIAEGRYASGQGWVDAAEASGTSVRVTLDGADQVRKYEDLTPAFRRRLLVDGARGVQREPAALFLTYEGLPLTPDAVRAAFSRACARCERLGVPMRASPHTLRHTYAVHMLSALVKASFRRVEEGRALGVPGDDHLLSELTADPVNTLRRLLGHRSVTTTYKYLTYIEQTQRFVAEAFDELDQMSALAERLGRGEDSA